MTSPLPIIFLAFLLCAINSCAGQDPAPDASDIYPVYNTSNCVFPFTYNGKTYNNCTLDGTNGDRPWCSLTSDYYGLFTKCYDFTKSSLQCVFPFTLNGKTFTQCDYLSRTSLYKQCKTNSTISAYKYRFCWEEHVQPTGQRLLHTNNCDSRYRAMSNYHTKCAGRNDYALEVPINASDKASLLDVHNHYRGLVNSTYMFKLYWDDTLADLAQTHADMCAFDHDLSANRMSLNYSWLNGQNMVMSTETAVPLSDLLRIMFDSEKPQFVYGSGCSTPGSCTHYSQLMINNITRVGCAQTHCLYPDRVERYLVCNYMLSQYSNNYMIPYVASSSPCSACKGGCNNNYTLNDCGGKICNFNSEYLDPCTCNCISIAGKRSVDEDNMNKRDADEDELNSHQAPYVALPAGGNLEGGSKSKRDVKKILFPQKHHPAKRELRKFKFDKKPKRQVSSNMVDAS